MRKIVIGASKSSKIGSKLIQWWIGAPYSHIYAMWYLSDQSRYIIYQASHGMVHFQSRENFLKENTVVKEVELELTCEQFQAFSSKCIDLAGEPYSKIELLQIILSDISNGRIQFKDQHGYICSELLAELMQNLGYTFDKPTFLINPKDIMNTLEK